VEKCARGTENDASERIKAEREQESTRRSKAAEEGNIDFDVDVRSEESIVK